ncbi:hypothetical protein F6I17_11430, partial [Escherichia coli]
MNNKKEGMVIRKKKCRDCGNAITPAMREGSGMVEFSRKFPDRYFDVAIAEQHAAKVTACCS